MRNATVEYVRKCDHCQRRREDRELIAPLGEVLGPKTPFEVTSMDITGACLTTPRGNKYLLTFTDHFTRFVEAFPIPDQTAEICARVYTQIITRQGSCSALVTYQDRDFMSFFEGTCKILGIHRIRTSELSGFK
jgi:hypothetical protein